MLTLTNFSAVLLLAGSAQLFGGPQVFAQQVDIDALAKAKTEAGREARSSHPFTSPRAAKAAGTFITFDVPGAGTGDRQGTFPASINQAGDIAGSYVDANGVSHSFVRAGNGTFTTFDVPGGTSSAASAISSAGSVTGAYFYLNDPNFVQHGYVRSRNGVFSTFDVPNNIGIAASSINPAGTVAGWDLDADVVFHGFVRGSDGIVTTIDAPGADTVDFFAGTFAIAINPAGTILGMYTDTNANTHAYLRASDGSFDIFDAPGQIATINSLFIIGPPLYMNPQGVITGAYFLPISGNPFGGNNRTFIRATDGTFTTFDAVPYPNGNPSLNIPCCTWTFPSGITPAGMLTGAFNDGFSVNHGFLRAKDGTLTTFDAPGAGTGFSQGTAPMGITPNGVIMGLYRDANSASHGFLFAPR